MKNPTSVLEDIIKLELGIELEEIKFLSKNLVRKTIKSQV